MGSKKVFLMVCMIVPLVIMGILTFRRQYEAMTILAWVWFVYAAITTITEVK